MKRFLYLITFAGLLISGCGPDMDIFFSLTDKDGNPFSSEIAFDAKSGSVTLYMNSSTTWQVTDLPNWIKMPMEGAAGTMNVHIQVDENRGNERTGTITISSFLQIIKITIKQEAFVPIYPETLSFLGEGGTKTFQITTNAIWSITDNVHADWITYTPNSGNGSAAINVTLKANPSLITTRSATLTITAKGFTPITVHINQERAMASPQFEIIPGSLYFSKGGGTRTLEVIANTTWYIDGLQNAEWVAATPTSGNGNATVSFTALASSFITSREVAFSFIPTGSSPVELVISQEKSDPFVTVSSNIMNFVAEGESKSFEVTSNTSWAISAAEPWITVSPASGTGDATVWVTATTNGSANRNTSLTLLGQDVATPVTVIVQQEKNNLKSAIPIPETFTSDDYYATEIQFTTNAELKNYIYSKFDPNADDWDDDLDHVMWLWGLSSPRPPIDETRLYRVTNALLFEYTPWNEPNKTLSVSVGEINLTAMTETITATIGFSLGGSFGSLSGSIEKTSSVTKANASTLIVESTYDLTQYEQDKSYKVILVGNLTVSYITLFDDFYYVEVDPSSLRVLLVHD